jgi:hypothetical protein
MVGASGMGYGERSDFSKGMDSPGPGTYESKMPAVLKKTTQKHLMGKSKRSNFSVPKASMPGPGHYKTSSVIAESAKYSFGLKHVDLNKSYLSNNPGPGNYSPEVGKKNDSKFSFGFRTENKNLQNSQNPGPGNYDISPYHKTGISFGSETKMKDVLAKSLRNNPGPGSYNYESQNTTKVRNVQICNFGSSNRTYEKNPTASAPGPGNYNIESNFGKSGP